MSSSQIVYIDGKYITADQNTVDRLSPGILKAKGVFETIRVYNKVPFALEKHYLRMLQGLHVLKVSKQISADQLAKIIKILLKKNRLKDARIRIQVWQDHKAVRFAVFLRPLDKSPKKKYRAMISRFKQNKSYRSHVKTLYYEHFFQALRDARNKGFDEAILLNHKNEVVEGAHTNIFIVKKGKIFTPSLSSGCLNGITRDLVLSCAKQLLIPWKECRLTLPQLFKADEIFLINSIIGIKSLVQIRNVNIHEQKTGIITQKISFQYRQFVNRYLKVKKSSAV